MVTEINYTIEEYFPQTNKTNVTLKTFKTEAEAKKYFYELIQRHNFRCFQLKANIFVNNEFNNQILVDLTGNRAEKYNQNKFRIYCNWNDHIKIDNIFKEYNLVSNFKGELFDKDTNKYRGYKTSNNKELIFNIIN